MPSIIPGYNYDIFISYRQKDNKHDGWVTEFVQNLKDELESTFKEEISVYFDINPHDGLLETNDVDASLKEKLKCLIFIPIISRTYCDPKSFAWEHEFKAFVEMASNDQLGLKIRLPNGNVSSRVLPIRIHDIENEDIFLLESILEGHLRSVDFIYKEAGINRQLRAKDDDILRKTAQYLYRDQINKVAMALKEIIDAIQKHVGQNKTEAHNEKTHDLKSDLPDESTGVIPSSTNTLKRPRRSKWKQLIVTSVLLIVIILASFRISHNLKEKWAMNKAIKNIRELALGENYDAAFRQALKVEKYISDPKVLSEASRYITRVSIITDPPGADVYLRKYSDVNGEWTKAGITPIDSLKLPFQTYYVARIEKQGYENVLATFHTSQVKLTRNLLKEKSAPPGMVYVQGLFSWLNETSLPEMNFYMDRYEVTNSEYKRFIDEGGYKNEKFWKYDFIKNNKKISREEALKEFTDKTGRPGPSTWEEGDFPDGQGNYPVSGVSWYEAMACAEFLGKELPTLDHWNSAAWSNVYSLFNFCSQIVPLSNFKGKGPEAIGINQGLNCFGAYDMAGNVREWCWNESQTGRVICGGAYDNIQYMYTQWSQLSPFDRSPGNGFRCALYIDKEKIPPSAFRKLKSTYDRDFYKEKPASDEVFRIYKSQFFYDKTDLDPKIEYTDSGNEDWTLQKISYNAAYPNERIVAYLFLPRNSNPPFQTMVCFPGTDAVMVKDILKYQTTYDFVRFILKSGRAVLYPVYKGTYERQANLDPLMTEPNFTHEYSQWLITWIKDFRRSMDYIETRNDLDSSKIGYYGYSWGGMLGGIIPAVESRIKLCVLYSGGFDLIEGNALPEADAINYVTRIKIPILMLNGKYDSFFPYETTVLPFLNLLGTSKEHKKCIVYETDHNVPLNEMVKETLNWLDKYFGPANDK